MTTNAPVPAAAPPAATLVVFRLAALSTFLAVALGAVVCATNSGAACPTWPGCHPSSVAPGWELSPVIEFTHRVSAIGAGPLVLAAAVLSLRLHRPPTWVRAMPWVALAGALAAGVFGRLVVVGHLPTALGAVDLASALTAMCGIGTATVVLARVPSRDAAAVPRPPSGPPVPLAAGTALVVAAVHVTGIFTAGTGSYTRCLGWPLWQTVDGDLHRWLQVVRLGLAAVAAVLVVTTVVVAWRAPRLRLPGALVGALLAAEAVLGLVIRGGGIDQRVAAAYSVTAAALLWSVALLAATAWTTPADGAGPGDPAQPRGEAVAA